MTQAVTLKNVRDFLYPIRLKWYDLGIELDIPGEELDEIKSKNKEDCGACLRDMIAARLKFKDDPLTWNHLEDALNARAIDEPQLAEQSLERSASFKGLEISIHCNKAIGSDLPQLKNHNRRRNIAPSIPSLDAQPSWKFPSPTRRFTITELPCYHGAMRGVQAEEKLKQQPGNSHLVRYSDSQREYILSVLKRGTDESIICQHFIINNTPNTSSPHPSNLYSVKGSDMVFNDAFKMLEYFKENPISYEISGIGEHCFAKPLRLREIPPRPSKIPPRAPEISPRPPEIPPRSPEQKIKQLDTSLNLNLYYQEGTISATSPKKTTSEKNTRQEETTSAMRPEEPTSEKNTRPEETTSEKNTQPEKTTSEKSTRKRRWCIIL